VFWQDIEDHYAGYAGLREQSCFLRETGVMVTNAPLKEEVIYPESMDRLNSGERLPITVPVKGKAETQEVIWSFGKIL